MRFYWVSPTTWNFGKLDPFLFHAAVFWCKIYLYLYHPSYRQNLWRSEFYLAWSTLSIKKGFLLCSVHGEAKPIWLQKFGKNGFFAVCNVSAAVKISNFCFACGVFLRLYASNLSADAYLKTNQMGRCLVLTRSTTTEFSLWFTIT